jgi:hypothetical protein
MSRAWCRSLPGTRCSLDGSGAPGEAVAFDEDLVRGINGMGYLVEENTPTPRPTLTPTATATPDLPATATAACLDFHSQYPVTPCP